MKTIELPLIPVTIQRARDTLVVEVPRHEIAILRALHSEVVEMQADAYVVDEFDKNAHAEFGRLSRKYETKNGQNVVQAVYRSPRELVEFGFADNVRSITEAQQSSNVDNRKKVSAKAA